MEPLPFVVGIAVGVIITMGSIVLARLVIEQATELPPGHPEFEDIPREPDLSRGPAVPDVLSYIPRRVELCYEGVETTDGRVIAPGALRFPEDPVPLAVMHHPDKELRTIGTASHFERGEGGVITGLLSVTVPNYFTQVELRDTEFDTGEAGLLIVTSGELARVALGATTVWTRHGAL